MVVMPTPSRANAITGPFHLEPASVRGALTHHLRLGTLHGSNTQYPRPYHTPWNRHTKVNILQAIAGAGQLGSSFDSKSKSNR
jgi:hypothetical protein